LFVGFIMSPVIFTCCIILVSYVLFSLSLLVSLWVVILSGSYLSRLLVKLRLWILSRSLSNPIFSMGNGSSCIQHLNQFCKHRFQIPFTLLHFFVLKLAAFPKLNQDHFFFTVIFVEIEHVNSENTMCGLNYEGLQ